MAEVSKKRATKKQVQNEFDLGNKNREKIKNLQTFDLIYFIGKSYLNDAGSQNYLIFKYFNI